MSWNDGYERKKLEQRLAKEATLLRANGVSENDISDLRSMSVKEHNDNRWLATHTQSFDTGFSSDNGDDGQSPLMENNLEELSVMEDYVDSSRYGWIESIENPVVLAWARKLDCMELEMVTLIAFEGFSKKDAAKRVGMPERTMKRRMAEWRKINIFQNIF